MILKIKKNIISTLMIVFFLPPKIDAKEPVRPLAWSWDSRIILLNANDQQKDKIIKATQLIKKVIGTEEFRLQILNYTFNGKRQFHQNLNRSNEAVYQMILQGAETVGNIRQNNRMDVGVEFYYQDTTTIGYTYSHVSKIWMNTKYFDQFDHVRVADNLIHEWMHKLGFDHETKWSEEREHSVPYAVGYIVENIGQKLISR